MEYLKKIRVGAFLNEQYHSRAELFTSVLFSGKDSSFSNFYLLFTFSAQK